MSRTKYDRAVARLQAAADEPGSTAAIEPHCVFHYPPGSSTGRAFMATSLVLRVPRDRASEAAAWMAPIAVETDGTLRGTLFRDEFTLSIMVRMDIEEQP